MDKETIIKLARECQMPHLYQTGEILNIDRLERFANLIARHEREECADMVDKYIKETDNMEARGCLASMAYDIRARGNT